MYFRYLPGRSLPHNIIAVPDILEVSNFRYYEFKKTSSHELVIGANRDVNILLLFMSKCALFVDFEECIKSNL